METPVHLTAVGSQTEADIICSLLRENGIKCGDRPTDVAIQGMGGSGGWREILVSEEQLEAARSSTDYAASGLARSVEGLRVAAAAGRAPASANSTVVAEETRLERRLDRALARATRPRGAALVIATVSTSITVGAGILMTVVDHDNFPSIGSGLWWAVQTVTTVGYGDHVPATVAGRLVAALVMLVGIGFLTVITATITSTFVSRLSREQTPSGAETPMEEQFRQIAGRLERIEAALTHARRGDLRNHGNWKAAA